jgi:hypothetical protein
MTRAATWLLLVVAVGCSRSTKQENQEALPSAAPAPVAPSSSSASASAFASVSALASASASASAPRIGLLDGPHDYRGTVGTSTQTAMHHERSGAAVHGSYLYVAIGKPIALDGTIDGAGAVTLTEKVDGKITGALHLAPGAGEALVGEWVSPKADKKLSAQFWLAPPWVAPEPDTGVQKRAEACLEDPTCPAADADALFVKADDAHDRGVDCQRFLDGAGTKRDLSRARACIERQLKGSDCAGSSVDLYDAELAVMRIDGIGGKQDIPAARAQLSKCFDDVTKSSVLGHADVKERDPSTPAMDFCKDSGGTTLTWNSCQARARNNETTRAQLQAKSVAEGLDVDQKKLFVAATKAYAAYVEAMSSYAYQVYIDGTIRNAMALARGRELIARRTKDLAAFKSWVSPDASADDAARTTKEVAATVAKVPTATADEKKELAKTQEKWNAYRDAEVLFYVSVFGPKQGADRVKNATTVRLETRRAKECAPPSPQGD